MARRLLTPLAVALLAALMPTAASGQARTPAELIALVEGAQPGTDSLSRMTIPELMRAFGVPGVSIAVIHESRIHWAKGYGTADVSTGAPVDTATLFQAASISKPVAAMATVRAAQDGRFGLDDDINTILRSWRLEGGEFTRERPVTPRTLLSHISGLGDAFGYPGYEPGAPLPTTVQLLEGHDRSVTGPIFMERAPWTAMEYSGGGATLMQLALSDARRRPFAEIMQSDVLRPIGMSLSTFEQPLSAARDRNAARGHNAQGAAQGPKWHVYPELAAAGLWTTASDLARFAIEVDRAGRGEPNRVLNRAMAQEMLNPVGVGTYAVGLSVAKIGEGWYFSHGGANWGFRANLIMHKAKGYGLAIMTNSDGGGPVMTEIQRRVRRAYAWDTEQAPVPRGYDPPVTTPPAVVASEVLARYPGAYASPDLTLSVRLENGVLQARGDGGGWAPLVPLSETEFVIGGGTRMRFVQDEAGTVTGLTVRISGRERLLRR